MSPASQRLTDLVTKLQNERSQGSTSGTDAPYTKDGNHVVVGTERRLDPGFVPSGHEQAAKPAR